MLCTFEKRGQLQCISLSGTTDLPCFCHSWQRRGTEDGWWMLVLGSLTLLEASHKCKGMSYCAVHKSWCRSVRLSLKLPGILYLSRTPAPTKVGSHLLSFCVSQIRDSQEHSWRYLHRPQISQFLPWFGLRHWAPPMPRDVQLCSCWCAPCHWELCLCLWTTALNWLSLEWEKDRICIKWREHFVLAVYRKISLFMSRTLFNLSLSSWGLGVQLSVLESVAAQLAASCALLLSPSQMLRGSLKVALLVPGWGFSAVFSWGRCVPVPVLGEFSCTESYSRNASVSSWLDERIHFS